MKRLFISLTTLFFVLCAHTGRIKAHEREIVIIICSYNNAQLYKANLDSVFSQDYSKFTVVYIDDCSPDGTGDLVQAYIKKYKLGHKITLIRNPYNRKALANMYRAIHQCPDTAIIVELDGDDAFSNPQVLSTINKTYDQDVWFTYAQFRNVQTKNYPDGMAMTMPAEVVKNRDYRNKFYWAGLRSFYAWIYQLIPLEHFLLPDNPPYTGKFLPAAKDGACIYPILEMAGNRFKFIKTILLDRNLTTISDAKVNHKWQVASGNFLRTIKKYDLLEKPVIGRLKKFAAAKADIVIFASHTTDLPKIIAQCQSHSTNWQTIWVLRSDDAGVAQTRLHENVRTILYKDEQDLSDKIDLIAPEMNSHLLLVAGDIDIKRPIDWRACIKDLEKTFAYCFYFLIDTTSFGASQEELRNAPCEQLWNDVYAWKICCFDPQVDYQKMALYRKSDALEMIKKGSIKNLAMEQKVGLFYEDARAH